MAFVTAMAEGKEMDMRLLVSILASLTATSSAAVPPPVAATADELRQLPVAKDAKVTLPGQKCPDDPRLRTTHGVERLQPRNLGELPPANLQLAVMRNMEGCVEPVIVRYGIGGSGQLPESGSTDAQSMAAPRP